MFLLLSTLTHSILQLSCYLLGIIVGGYFFKIVDLTKIVKIKNNKEFYFVYFISTCVIGFLLGEFIFKLVTLFV